MKLFQKALSYLFQFIIKSDSSMTESIMMDSIVFRKEEILRAYERCKNSKHLNKFEKKAAKLFEKYGNPNNWTPPFVSRYGESYEEQRREFLNEYIDKSEVAQDFIKQAVDDLLTMTRPNTKEIKYPWFPYVKKYSGVKNFDLSTEEHRKAFREQREDALYDFVTFGIIQNDDAGRYLRKDGHLSVFTFDADTSLKTIKKIITEYEQEENKEEYLSFIFESCPQGKEKYWELSLNEVEQKLYESMNGKKKAIHTLNDPKYFRFWQYLFKNQNKSLRHEEIRKSLGIKNLKVSDYLGNSKIIDERKSRYFPNQENNRILLFKAKYIEK